MFDWELRWQASNMTKNLIRSFSPVLQLCTCVGATTMTINYKEASLAVSKKATFVTAVLFIIGSVVTILLPYDLYLIEIVS